MKLSLKWLRDYVDVDVDPAAFAARFTDTTAEVEGWDTIGGEWDRELITVAAVRGIEQHPNADRLRLATVETGNGERKVVCGAPNLEVGQKVAFATAGAELFDGHIGKRTKLKPRPIRGVDSDGMVLSERELGLSDDHEGILVLPDNATVGRALSDEIGDLVFDISTWANRADLLGVVGLAREAAAVYQLPLNEPDLSYTEAGPAVGDLVKAEIGDPDLCRRLTMSIIQDLKVGPSPAWMQERLTAAGMRPINNLVDITNYVMLETGQPIHAFDYDYVRGQSISARRAKPGEHLKTLDGIDRELDPDMLMICDGEGPVGVAGVMGGGNSEVSEKTTTILLEVANFHPGSIRRTSTQLKLRSEASLRFEKGLGPEVAEYARRRALNLYEAFAGGTCATGHLDLYPGKTAASTVALTDARIQQVLGMAIPADEVHRVLSGLGFGVERTGDGYNVTSPGWRIDVTLPDDVIEELIRVYGYDKLPTTTLRGALPEPEPDPAGETRERLSDTFAGLGFQETIHYTLTDMDELRRVVDPSDTRRLTPIGVMNPVASQHTFLRTSLRPMLLRTYAANRGHEDGPLRLFEAAFEYLPREEDLPAERTVLAAVVGGPREARWRRPGDQTLDFFDAKGAVEAALTDLGVVHSFETTTEHGLLEGHTAAIKAGKKQIGILGQVHPSVASAVDIDEPVFLLELWIDEVTAAVPERPDYTPPSRYPAVLHDLALVVDDATPATEVADLVRSHRSGDVSLTADIFDEYRGPGVPDGKKSLAIAIRYQATERTLTEKDIQKVQQGLLKRLEKATGATLRA